MSKIALHPALDLRTAKRLAEEHGCKLVFTGGRLRMKQRRVFRGGAVAYESHARAASETSGNRVLVLALARELNV